MGKFGGALEIFIITVAIMVRIWLPMPVFLTVIFTFAIIAAIVLSLILHRENFSSIGLRPENWKNWPLIRIITIVSVIAIFLIGLWANNSLLSQFPGLALRILVSVIGYFFWAFFQQTLLNGYLLNRLLSLFEDKKLAILYSSTIFSMIHSPNLFLIILTFMSGIVSTNLFLRSRNVYLLAFSHAVLASSVSHLLPADWHHYLVIGPRFF